MGDPRLVADASVTVISAVLTQNGRSSRTKAKSSPTQKKKKKLVSQAGTLVRICSDFEWKYIKGTDNTVAGALSRLYEPEPLNAITLEGITTRVRRPPQKRAEPRASSLTKKRKHHHTKHTIPSGPSVTIGQGTGVLPKPSGPSVTIGQGAGGKPIDCGVEPGPRSLSENQHHDLSVMEHMADGYRLDPWFSYPTNTTFTQSDDGLW
jgi:hypothetical protein